MGCLSLPNAAHSDNSGCGVQWMNSHLWTITCRWSLISAVCSRMYMANSNQCSASLCFSSWCSLILKVQYLCLMRISFKVSPSESGKINLNFITHVGEREYWYEFMRKSKWEWRIHRSWAVFVVDDVIVYFLSLFTFRYHFLSVSCYWHRPVPYIYLTLLVMGNIDTR